MSSTLKWEPHRYGGGESAKLAPDLVLDTNYSTLREESDMPWGWSAWGTIRGKKRFKTSTEAKEAAERFARRALTAGLTTLGTTP